MAAIATLSAAPKGFTTGELAAKVQHLSGQGPEDFRWGWGNFRRSKVGQVGPNQSVIPMLPHRRLKLL